MKVKTRKYFAETITLIMGIGMAAAFILGWINGDDNIGSVKWPLVREAAVEMFIYLLLLFAATIFLLLTPPSQSKENNQPDIENALKKSRKIR